MRQARVNRAVDAEQVHLDDPLPTARIHSPQGAQAGDSRVGHHDVDAAEALDRSLNSRVERVAIRHVGLEPRGIAALRRDGLEQLGLQPHERQLSSARREAARGLGPDAPCGARDQHGLPSNRLRGAGHVRQRTARVKASGGERS
jgi:hypothetical protein